MVNLDPQKNFRGKVDDGITFAIYGTTPLSGQLGFTFYYNFLPSSLAQRANLK